MFRDNSPPILPSIIKSNIQDSRQLPIGASVWQPGCIHLTNQGFMPQHVYRSDIKVSSVHPVLPIASHLFNTKSFAKSGILTTLHSLPLAENPLKVPLILSNDIFVQYENGIYNLVSYDSTPHDFNKQIECKSASLSVYRLTADLPFNQQISNSKCQLFELRNPIKLISCSPVNDTLVFTDDCYCVRSLSLSNNDKNEDPSVDILFKFTDLPIVSLCQSNMFTFVNQQKSTDSQLSILHSGSCTRIRTLPGQFQNLVAATWHPMHLISYDENNVQYVDVRSMCKTMLLYNCSPCICKCIDSMNYTIQVASERHINNVDIRYPNHTVLNVAHELLSHPKLLENISILNTNVCLFSDGESLLYQLMNKSTIINDQCRLDQFFELSANDQIRKLFTGHICEGEYLINDHLNYEREITGLSTCFSSDDSVFVFTKLANGLIQIHKLMYALETDADCWSSGPWLNITPLPDEYILELKHFYDNYRSDEKYGQMAECTESLLNENPRDKKCCNESRRNKRIRNSKLSLVYKVGQAIDACKPLTDCTDITLSREVNESDNCEVDDILNELPDLDVKMDSYAMSIIEPWIDMIPDEFPSTLSHNLVKHEPNVKKIDE
ncbi:hypothetical protein GJ496_005469 [Pomphorhynchus laevis]|nr:hypothetical protein GJ496_005469 [Pomphorhynchus laevis]